jgi:hypothetical protein
MHVGFAGWGALANDAGLLHQQIQQLLYPPLEEFVGPAASARAADTSSGNVDVWQQVVETTSLGYAVRASTGNRQ